MERPSLEQDPWRFGRVRYVSLQTGRYEAGFEQCYAFWRPLLVITYFTAP